MKSLQGRDRTLRGPARPVPSADQGQERLGCDQLGRELKVMFGGLTAGPMPDRIKQLADALEEALVRGDLFDGRPPRRSS